MTSEPLDPENSRSWRDWLARHLGLGGDQKFEIYLGVAKASTLRDATYWAELLLSAGIATVGLTLNSPAVIIGAMLISPLMGPIMSGGLALAAGDFLLGLRAVFNLALSSLAAVAFSTVLVVLLPFREMTAEIASRTHPNTLDLVVALFSGAVGALAICKSLRGVATSIPGVAIAVALMPPLCVTGYGVGVLLTTDRAQGMAVLAGGGLLFVTNLVAITFSSMVVFLLLHIDSESVREKIRRWRTADPEAARFQHALDRMIPDVVERIGSVPARLVLGAVLVVTVFVPLKRSFDALSTEIDERQSLNRSKQAATEAWEELFGKTPGGTARSYIDSLDVAEHDGDLALTVRTFISESITSDERDAYARAVARTLGKRTEDVHVAVVEIPTATYQLAKAKSAADPSPAPPPESAGSRFRRAAQALLAQAGATRLPPGAVLLDASLTVGSGSPVATLNVLAPGPISDDARALVAADLRTQLDLPALDVRWNHVPSRISLAFDLRRPAIAEAAFASLDAMAAATQSRSRFRAAIHAPGSDALSAARAGAVRAALTARGLAAERIVDAVSADVPRNEIVLSIEDTAAVIGSKP